MNEIPKTCSASIIGIDAINLNTGGGMGYRAIPPVWVGFQMTPFALRSNEENLV